MTQIQDLPFGGFPQMVKLLKEITLEKWPDRADLQANLESAQPSTSFGLFGLGLRWEEFSQVTEVLMDRAKIAVVDDGPGTSLGGYMASIMAARHADEQDSLVRHLEGEEGSQF